jgi:hypothetical protein
VETLDCHFTSDFTHFCLVKNVERNMGRTSTRKTLSLKKRKAESRETEAPNKKKLPVENDVDVVEDDDIIYLNVGGETMACNRSTLCQVEGSFLASMFSGRWENQQKKDKDGNVRHSQL